MKTIDMKIIYSLPYSNDKKEVNYNFVVADVNTNAILDILISKFLASKPNARIISINCNVSNS